MYKTIKDQLVAILGGVSSVKVVYGKEEKKLADFPAVCISAKQHSSQYDSVGTSGVNLREYEHFVRVYFRTDEENDPDYEDVLEGVADDVVSALEQNVTLNSVCDYSIPVTGVWRFGNKEVPVRIFELIVRATVRIRRDTQTQV